MIINGPIASGKSTIALALAAICEGAGRTAAVVDLDEVWHMVAHQTPRTSALGPWLTARRAAAAITDTFFAEGIRVVITEGPFFTEDERTAYLRWLRTRLTPRFVTLNVSFEEAYRRAQADPHPGRVVSRDRTWLAERYAATRPLLEKLPASEPVIPTDGTHPHIVASGIARALDLVPA